MFVQDTADGEGEEFYMKQKVMAYDIISYILEMVQLNSTVSIRNISNRHSKTKNSNSIP